MGKKLFSGRLAIIIILIVLVALNFVATSNHARFDLTNEKRFTLSEPTKQLLKKIDQPIRIDIFLKGNYPSGFKQLSNTAEDLLREFQESAGDKIRYTFKSPDDLVAGTEIKYADTLTAMGLFPINLTSQLKEGQQQQFIYPFALVYYADKILPVELYKGKTPLINFAELNSSEALLEYRFANAISEITKTDKTVIGYATGNGEPENFTTYDLIENVLTKDYNLYTFNLSNAPFIPTEIKALIIVKPTIAFTDEQKLKLDQYVMNGGRLLFFGDRLNAEMDSLQIKNEVTAFDRNLQINDLFFNFGARINADLLMDLQCDDLPFDVNGNGQFDLLPWNYFPVIGSPENHPINKGLGFVSGRFVNSIDTVEADGIKKTILLHSSANARTIGAPAVISGAENVNAPQNEKYNRKDIPAAILLEGKFSSMFTNRLTQAMNDSMRVNDISFLPKATTSNKIIIVGDGDIILNSIVKGNPIPMGTNPYTYGTQREFPFANKEFLKNCLDYLVNENGLSEAKAKDYKVRLLNTTKVETQKTTWQVINIVLPLAIVLLFAFIFQWVRRRKYVK